MESTHDGRTEVSKLEDQIAQLKTELAAARAALPPEPVEEYTLETLAGSTTLADLFGDNDKLLVVHNMGRTCPYCTLWADGFIGLLPHIETRSGFVIVSPDDPASQKEFADSRGWPFRMASDPTHAFTKAMGYRNDDYVLPGVSAFIRDEEGRVFRTAHTAFGPGDDFSAVWHLFDLFDGAALGWGPRL